MPQKVAIVGVGGPLVAPHLARALARLESHPAPLIIVDPKSMNETKPETLVVEDTKPKLPTELEVKPKSSCKHCLGRGYVGTDTRTRKKIMCRCVERSFQKVNRERKRLERELAPAEVTASKGWEKEEAPAPAAKAIEALKEA